MAQDDKYIKARLLADAWCSVFVWEKRQGEELPLTDLLYRHLEAEPQSLQFESLCQKVAALTDRFGFFHWHVAFPAVFQVPDDLSRAENEAAGWNGGFDVVLGNPPWEKYTILETEFFESRDEIIAATKTKAERNLELKKLPERNPTAYQEWVKAKRMAASCSHFIKTSGRYPLSSRGEINTYLPFAGLSNQIIDHEGFAGLVLKSSIFTSSNASDLFASFMVNRQLAVMYDFRNWENLFPNVGYHERFALTVFSGKSKRQGASHFAFHCNNPTEITDRAYKISPEQIKNLSPNSKKVPTLPRRRDLDLMLSVSSRHPILVQENFNANPWAIEYIRMFDASGFSGNFKDKESLVSSSYQMSYPMTYSTSDSALEDYVPFYEGKFVHIYDHRFSSFEGVPHSRRFGRKPGTHTPTALQKEDPFYSIETRYWIPKSAAGKRIEEKIGNKEYFCGARLVTNVISNARTVIGCILPSYPTNNLLLCLSISANTRNEYTELCALFTSLLNSFPFDYLARLRISENLLKGDLYEVLVIPPRTYTATLSNFITSRVLELTYTAWDMQPFATDLCYEGAPFVWDDERRFLLRCELDALYFHLYSIGRDDVDYIMDTFPIVKKKDITAHGEYRTKRVILKMYDQMADLPTMLVPAPKEEHGEMEVPDVSQWLTPLDPPPADPLAAHAVR